MTGSALPAKAWASVRILIAVQHGIERVPFRDGPLRAGPGRVSTPARRDDEPVRPALSPEAAEWRARYERAIADGSVRRMPTVDQQFDSIREEILRNAT